MSRDLIIFTSPREAVVELRHDVGTTYHGQAGEADGRPAHILQLDESLPEGHGARLIVTSEGCVPVEQRGSLWLQRGGPRAEFLVDDVYLQPSFRRHSRSSSGAGSASV